MHAFILVFTMLAAPTNVAANAPATFTPVTTIEISGKTEKNAAVNCARFVKAAQSAGMYGTCEPQVASK